MALNVLLIEDDQSAADGIALMLRAEGLSCDVVGLGADGVEQGQLHPYDIILLDLMLPDMNGYEVLRRLRAAQISTPVIILSGLDELDNKVVGLGSGADDYLTKPIERRELIARIGAHVRRSMGHMSGPGIGLDDDAAPILAQKGAASPWSFDMSYVPPDLVDTAAAVVHRESMALPAPRFERPWRDETAPCRIVVVGCEKGGSGKSTTAMQVAGSLLAGGHRVICLDLDLRQKTLGRYFENRRSFAAATETPLPMPELLPLEIADNDAEALDAIIAEAVERTDFLVIDSPGSATGLARAAHAWADTLITPINDSFVDLDVLGRIDEKGGDAVDVGAYGGLVEAAREDKAAHSSRPMDWVVLRNRLAPRDTRNTRRMTGALVTLSRRLGFRGSPGLTDRLIFRELFRSGLSLADLPAAGIGQGLTMSHVAARQELRALMDALRLTGRGTRAESRHPSSAAGLIPRLRRSG